MAAILGIALVGTTATFGCSGYAKPLSWRPAIIENFKKRVPNRRSQASGMAPLLASLIEQRAATGLPPAYLPKDEAEDQ
jgi:hypothetical protein